MPSAATDSMLRTSLFADLAPQSVHAATITESARADRLLAACYSFSYETAPDSRIMTALWSQGRWEAARTLVDLPGLAVGNPVLYTDRHKVTHLFFVIVYRDEWTTARIAHMTSDDFGESWSEIHLIHEQAGLMTKTRPLELDGRLLLPVYDEVRWCSHVLIAQVPYTDWQLYGDTTARGKIIQPCIIPLEGERLLMYSRSKMEQLWASYSFNGGFSWTASQATPLPNPNSGIDLLRLQSGNLLLVYNPTRRGRDQLALALSSDEGASWSAPVLIENSLGEYSYPYAIQTRNGDIHLLYTHQRISITHLSFNETWLLNRLGEGETHDTTDRNHSRRHHSYGEKW